VDHALERNRAGVRRAIVIGKQIPIALPMPQIKCLARIVVIGQQVLREVVELLILSGALCGGIPIKRPNVAERKSPQDEMVKWHIEHGMAGAFLASQSHQIGDVRWQANAVLPRKIRTDGAFEDVTAQTANGQRSLD